MKRSLAFAYVGGLFILGILIGALGMHLFYAARFPPRPGPSPRHGFRPGEFYSELYIERLDRQLDLTAEQERRIGEIMERGRTEADALRREIRPKVRAQMAEARRQIAEVLTPEQREEFERLNRRQRRRSRFFLGR